MKILIKISSPFSVNRPKIKLKLCLGGMSLNIAPQQEVYEYLAPVLITHIFEYPLLRRSMSSIVSNTFSWPNLGLGHILKGTSYDPSPYEDRIGLPSSNANLLYGPFTDVSLSTFPEEYRFLFSSTHFYKPE